MHNRLRPPDAAAHKGNARERVIGAITIRLSIRSAPRATGFEQKRRLIFHHFLPQLKALASPR